MTKLNFLKKIHNEEKLELVTISKEISMSYEKKAIECREVAKLAFKNNYFLLCLMYKNRDQNYYLNVVYND